MLDTFWADLIYTVEYYSAIRRDGILSFVTTWMDLENTMQIKEVRQKKSRTMCFHSYVGYKTESKK